ncbi:MAG: PA3496 family putative envelope integrity protein [Pseudomonadales bacterium]|jgi:hypothetical protein|uniref:PA3496 family putative envelope integrity protein n=1 Tax=uncultured Shewanella sp. TaxID=173975 RepID=UPI0030B5B739|tara:strand:+ start:3570 stop:3758 length:189 start_codon:yes stop_codon:yes gene_type:complete
MAASISNNNLGDSVNESEEDNIVLPVDEISVDKDSLKTLEVRRKIEDILEARRLKKEFDFDF